MQKGDVVRIGDYELKLVRPMTPSGFKNGQLWQVEVRGASELLYKWIPETATVEAKDTSVVTGEKTNEK